MKSVVYILLIIVLASCSKSNSLSYETPTEYDKTHSVKVNLQYYLPIDGYTVTVTCFVDTTSNTDSPQSQGNKTAILGRGYIHFKNNENEFVVENPCFTESSLLANELALYNDMNLNIKYKPFIPNTDNRMILQGNDTPFFFYDIDMDGEKELVVTIFEGMEYHGHNSYEIYKINQSDSNNILSPIADAPFNEINDYTEFDFMNKAITPHEIDAMKIQGDSTYKMR